MADPLTLLRSYNVNKKEIIQSDGHVLLGDTSWPKNAKTNYLIYGSGKDGLPKEYYTLECLLFFLQNVQLTHSMYVRKAAAESIMPVRRPDRKDILAYLNGELASSSSIDKSAPLEIPVKIIKRPADENLENLSKKPCFEEMMKAKEQLAAKLEAPKELLVKHENVKSLSDTMSAEKIAEIKAKRIAKKRTTIKENIDMESNNDVGNIFGMDDDDIKTITSRERQWRTRSTILQSNGKLFAKNVFAILQSVKAKEEGILKGPQSVKASMTPKPTPARYQPTAYNRYDQERFNRQREETEGFKIDTMGTYHGSTLKSVMEGKTHVQRKPDLPTPTTPTSKPLGKVAPLQSIQGNKRVSKTPIIIVPSTNTSLISMYNVKDVLQDFKFVTSDQKRVENAKRENDILIQRRKEGGLTVPYRVIDNPHKLNSDDWDRVVAVFVMGPAWQFKGWPYNGDPVQIFSKICAFHMMYDEMRTDPNVAKWAVEIIHLSKTKRHLDRAAIMKFWEVLDKYMITYKPSLRF